jgi:hypothetical protein
MTTSYHYTSLAGAREIRVLQLASGDNSAPLRGQIHHVNLDLCPAYEALSYEWGDPKKERTLYLNNGTQIAVTKSLYDALRDIRHGQGSRVVWADGICIYPIRSIFSCRRFWRHRPARNGGVYRNFSFRNRRIFSPFTSRVICEILVSDILTVAYKRRGLPIRPHNLNTLFLIAPLPFLQFFSLPGIKRS